MMCGVISICACLQSIRDPIMSIRLLASAKKVAKS
jgi:hypothetical protein